MQCAAQVKRMVTTITCCITTWKFGPTKVEPQGPTDCWTLFDLVGPGGSTFVGPCSTLLDHVVGPKKKCILPKLDLSERSNQVLLDLCWTLWVESRSEIWSHIVSSSAIVLIYQINCIESYIYGCLYSHILSDHQHSKLTKEQSVTLLAPPPRTLVVRRLVQRTGCVAHR